MYYSSETTLMLGNFKRIPLTCAILLALPTAYADTASCNSTACTPALQTLKHLASWDSSTVITKENILAPLAISNAGLSETNPNSNTVNIIGVPVGLSIKGVYCAMRNDASDVQNNVLNISAGSFAKYSDITCGYSSSGNVYNNSINISGGEFVDTYIAAADSISGDVTSNTITITGVANIDSGVIAGYSNSGNVSDNTTVINKYLFSKGFPEFYGGVSTKGDVKNNQLTISDSSSHSDSQIDAIGGSSNGGVVSGNSVVIRDSVLSGVVKGGTFQNGNATAYTSTVDVNNNTVNISGSRISGDILGGSSYFTAPEGNLTNNTVVISDSIFSGNVFGASPNSLGNSIGNTVTINGGSSTLPEYNDSFSITSRVCGGRISGTDKKANNNVVRLNDVKLIDNYPDDSLYFRVCGGLDQDNGEANGNIVNIRGGTIHSNIFGGISRDGEATNNTINISDSETGKPTFHNNTKLYGGYDDNTNTVNDVKTGNTLNMRTSDIVVNNIANFANLFFYVPEKTVSNTTFVTLTDNSINGIDLRNISFGICVPKTVNSSLSVGDTLTLISAQRLSTEQALTNDIRNMDDCSSSYQFSLKTVGANIVATVVDIVPSYPVLVNVEGLNGTVVLQNNGADRLTINSNGMYTFTNKISDGENYSVSVLTQPDGQLCAVNQPQGHVSADTNVQVTCSDIILGKFFQDSFE